jgi:hypothetical protein
MRPALKIRGVVSYRPLASSRQRFLCAGGVSPLSRDGGAQELARSYDVRTRAKALYYLDVGVEAFFCLLQGAQTHEQLPVPDSRVAEEMTFGAVEEGVLYYQRIAATK